MLQFPSALRSVLTSFSYFFFFLVCKLLLTEFLWFYYIFLKCSLGWCTCNLLLPNPGHRPTSVIESHTPKNAAVYMHFTLYFENLVCSEDILWLLAIIAVYRQRKKQPMMNQTAWGWWWRESRIAQWRLQHPIHLKVKVFHQFKFNCLKLIVI